MGSTAQAIPKKADESTSSAIDFDMFVEMESFNKLVKKKNGFLFTTTFLFLIAYSLLPILAFTEPLQQKAIGNITWVWIYSISLFLMTIILCTLYVKRAQKFDKEVAAVIEEYQQRKDGQS